MTLYRSTSTDPMLSQGIALSLHEIALSQKSDPLVREAVIELCVRRALSRFIPELEAELDQGASVPESLTDQVFERILALWKTLGDQTEFMSLVATSLANVSNGLASAEILRSATPNDTSPTIAGGAATVRSWLAVAPDGVVPVGSVSVSTATGSGKSFLPHELVKSLLAD